MDPMNTLVISFVVFFFLYVLYTMFSKRGRGNLLGGTIIDSSREEITQKVGMIKTTIRAHVIESKTKNKHIGLEIAATSILSADIKPIKLSKSEAETLVRMLREAISRT